jgi:predicted DNA-binding WGR domain protein
MAIPILQSGEVTMPTTNTKHRFEFVAGSSDKFGEIEVKGKEVLVRFGRNGTNGQSSTKSFADEVAAKKHADKLIAEKIAKGYVEAA